MKPRQTPLAPRDLLVLSALAGGPLHGYGIIKAVEAETDSARLLDPANLYRLLRRMRADGWVEEVPEAPADPADSRRRAYQLTTRGRDVLLSEIERLEELLARVRPVLVGGPAR